MPETLRLTPHETVTIRESSPELLEVEGSWGPRGKAPPVHYHPAQDEHFEVLEGTLTARVEGEERELDKGETLDIPRECAIRSGTGAPKPTRALWQTAPGPEDRAVVQARSIAPSGDGRVDGKGMPGPLAFGVYLTEFRDVFRLGNAPDLCTRPVLADARLDSGARGATRSSPEAGRRARGANFSLVAKLKLISGGLQADLGRGGQRRSGQVPGSACPTPMRSTRTRARSPA